LVPKTFVSILSQVESCKPLNDPDRGRPWSKYAKENVKNSSVKAAAKSMNKNKKETPQAKPLSKEEKKAKKLDALLGPLKDDAQFKEFLAANKAIKGNENIWKNDIHLSVNDETATEKQEKPTVTVEDERTIEKSAKAPSAKEAGSDDDDDDADFENGRLFVRNLCYTCSEEELEKLFAPYAPIVETNMPIDNFSKKPKGFAYVTFMFPEKALKAFNDLDGTIFQGRMLHIIPARSKKENNANQNGDEMKFKAKKDSELKKVCDRIF
jgi:RNA recognition motif-containing protein